MEVSRSAVERLTLGEKVAYLLSVSSMNSHDALVLATTEAGIDEIIKSMNLEIAIATKAMGEKDFDPIREFKKDLRRVR